jgi:hypothetical protein
MIHGCEYVEKEEVKETTEKKEREKETEAKTDERRRERGTRGICTVYPSQYKCLPIFVPYGLYWLDTRYK